jgi:hypothetical protein
MDSVSDYQPIVAGNWVPQSTAKSFSSLHEGLCRAIEDIYQAKRNGENRTLIFKPSKAMGSQKADLNMQVKAIGILLTDKSLGFFWDKCTPDQAEELKKVWHQAMNDWVIKPDISTTKKKKKLQQAQKHVDKIAEIMNSDPSLQREISIALTEAINNQWPTTRNIGDDWEALEMIHSGHFFKKFSNELKKTSTLNEWQSTHRKYPAHINEPTAKKQFLIKRFSPIIYNVCGHNDHAAVALFLRTVFSPLRITNGAVRQTNA